MHKSRRGLPPGGGIAQWVDKVNLHCTLSGIFSLVIHRFLLLGLLSHWYCYILRASHKTGSNMIPNGSASSVFNPIVIFIFHYVLPVTSCRICLVDMSLLPLYTLLAILSPIQAFSVDMVVYYLELYVAGSFPICSHSVHANRFRCG